MHKIGIVSFFVLASSIFLILPASAEQQIPVNVGGGGAADLLNMTSMPPALQDSHADDDGVRHFCTDRYGRIVQQADPHYADCLRNRKADTVVSQPSATERSAAKAAGGAP